MVVISAPTTSDGATPQFRFNGDTATNYSNTFLEGNGTSATSNRETSQTNIQLSYNVGGNSTNPSTSIVHIMNYSNATTFKTLLARWNSASGGTYPGTAATVGLWRKTPEAISSMEIFVATGNFAVGSTFSLYGIAAEPQVAKATGGTITYANGYWVHTFTSSGTFTPNQALTCDYLVVAGGGSGGSSIGGGGGGGGFRTATSQSLTATGYTVTIGAGGASTNSSTVANKGSNSIFNALTATGGGKGGNRDINYPAGDPGGAGGSGGGGSGAEQSTGRAGGAGNEGAYSPVEGYAGGTGAGPYPNFAGAGGGGAGAVGGNASGYTPGAGGAGASSSITGTAVTYAGGGGGGGYQAVGGAGGSGGGGTGGRYDPVTNAGNGTANTGGGGGGSGGTAGSGGSGIVIIRYPN